MVALYAIFDSREAGALYDAVLDCEGAYFATDVYQFLQSWNDEELTEGVYAKPELVARLSRVSGVTEVLIGGYPGEVPDAPDVPSDFARGACDLAARVYDGGHLLIFAHDAARLQSLQGQILTRLSISSEFDDATI